MRTTQMAPQTMQQSPGHTGLVYGNMEPQGYHVPAQQFSSRVQVRTAVSLYRVSCIVFDSLVLNSLTLSLSLSLSLAASPDVPRSVRAAACVLPHLTANPLSLPLPVQLEWASAERALLGRAGPDPVCPAWNRDTPPSAATAGRGAGHVRVATAGPGQHCVYMCYEAPHLLTYITSLISTS